MLIWWIVLLVLEIEEQCLTGAVLMYPPLTAANRVDTQRRHVRWSLVTKSGRWVSPGYSGYLPHEDNPNANIGANEHD